MATDYPTYVFAVLVLLGGTVGFMRKGMFLRVFCSIEINVNQFFD